MDSFRPHVPKLRRVGAAVLILGAALLASCTQDAPPAANAAEPAPTAATAPERTPNDWIFNAENEEARIAALQLQLRGLDVAMWEIGERYESLHAALGRDNTQLALYHWDKIKQSLDNALVRRPARRANAESLFLDTLWAEARQAFAEGTVEDKWAAFETVRTSCMACHDAENVTYMNDMAMFDLRAP